MDTKSVENFVCTVEPFSRLPREIISEVVQTSTLRSCNAKEIIFFEGDPASAGHLLMSGRVALLKSSANGKELIIELVPTGELFGIVAFFYQKPYPLTARAQIDSICLVLNKTHLEPYFQRFPELQKGMMGIITERMQGTQNLARALAHDRVETRVAAILLALIPRFSGDTSNTIDLNISRQEIADLAGITLETASRIIKGMERDSMLDASKTGTVRIFSQDALRDLT